ncbi:TnsA endonuclease N-terminal domain-containing protein [Niallia sp. FSL R7-0648]|uniref:TnsA endonuclease N-terminal domain-containing protein n=1 Tax=Niallia sp. FSL R7-0648 TaxID=2954521 RepID=UPI0030FBE96C
MYTPVITDGSKRYGNNRWYSFSPKLKRNIYLFSDLEYEHWLLVESDPQIVDFCEQPLEIISPINGKAKNSIFDMWVKYKNGNQEFREIKYSTDLKKANVIEQITVQQDWCIKNGYKHRVKTEKEIRENRCLLSNLKIILKTIKQSVPSEIDQYKIKKLLKDNFPQRTSLETIIQISKISPHRLLSVIGFMIINGEIQSNISQNYFGINTEVWING